MTTAMLKRLGAAAGVALAMTAASAQAMGPTPPSAFDAAITKTKTAMMGDPQAALGLSLRAVSLAKTAGSGDPSLRVATAQWLEGEALSRVGRPGEAVPIIDQALAVVSVHQPNSKLQGDLLMSHGGAVALLGKVEDALSDYQRAFDIYRVAGEARGQAKALQNIGSIYQDAGDYPRVLKYYAQSAEAYKDDPILLVTAANNKGDAYTAMKQFDPAIAEYKVAIGIARQMDSPGLEASILANLAAAEVKAGRLGPADIDVARGLKLAEKASPEERPFLWGVAAQSALARGSTEQARQLLAATFRGVDLKTTTAPYRDFHETAYQTFLRLGDSRLALAHLEAFKRLDDAARSVAASTNSALMAARFDFANQDLKISKLKAGQLQRDVQLARQRNTITTGLLGGSGLLLALLAFGFISIRRSRDEVRAANVKLTDTNVALEGALKAKSDFLAATSHEIRTPLNGILGMTQVLLADRTLAPELKERIGLVQTSGETMKALVDDILDVSKMQTGKLAIEKTEVDAHAILEETGRLWAEKAHAKTLGMTIEIDPGLGRIVEDGGRLRQIVFNLLSNAIKFTHEGGVRLHARPEIRGDVECLVIEVSDTGIGIPEDSHAEIFEPFTQVDSSTTRQYGGTGLGLAICRDLVSAMGGEIGLTSETGRGSVFTIVLPLTRASEREDGAPEGDSASGAPLADCRLLVIEGNPLAQSVLRSILSAEVRGLEIIGGVDAALEMLRLQRFDHILADGAALAPELDERVAKLGRLAEAAGAPVTLLWPAPDEALVARLRAAGAAEVLAKPISPPDLVAALRRAREALAPAAAPAEATAA